ncbi:MAG: bifunctional aspartate kinase/homoserine dehydrogenase I [Saprospirales bacterium]|nr:bifunctional aspartate kinase/homoserine dehydrogenase I [Saprospirales bacterium]
MIVLKFGGTSVADAQRLKNVADIIRRQQKKKKKVVAVLSALSGVTDSLLRMCYLASLRDNTYLELFAQVHNRHLDTIHTLNLKEDSKLDSFVKEAFAELQNMLHGVYLLREQSPRTLDFVSAFGELLSTRMLYAYFQLLQIPSSFWDGRALIQTDEHFGAARVDFRATNKNLRHAFDKLKGVGLMTGFIASTAQNETTTLGRGGSDYTAAIVGAALDAEEIQIWTDVDGVMTADPRKVKKAFSIPSMTYEEAMELSHFGAKVIHPPTIQPAMAKGIPLYIKNSFHPEHPGTRISKKQTDKTHLIKGISSIDDVSLLTVKGSGMVGVAGTSARLFNAIYGAGVNVILITQGSSEHSISFAVKPSDTKAARQRIESAFELEMQVKLIEPVQVEEGLSVVAVIGENMRHTPGVSGRLFQALGKNGINVVAIAQGSSELNVSLVIGKHDLAKALNSLHQGLFLSENKILNVFLVGVGLIGSTLLQQLEKQRQFIRESKMLEINLAGIANSRQMVLDESGISIDSYRERLQEGEAMDLAAFVDRMNRMNLPQSIFVDCTSSPEVVKSYRTVLSDSISIVTPNKLGNSGKYRDYQKLQTLAKRRNVRFLYETNVGAGLPVINTLKDLLHSGDRIIRIEAVLSGTLSYIFNNYKKGESFSSIVREAHARGFTEPDPRDDLSGMDVARKLLILARETGIPLEMNDIRIEKILPAACRKAPSVDAFFEELEKADTHFEKYLDRAQANGTVLRFIAQLENGNASIALREVDAGHPFFFLSGSDNIISYTTDRYLERPLVVKGPGAGAEVTAAGVFAEIISIGNYFE